MEIYALCEVGREEGFLRFLREVNLEKSCAVTAVLAKESYAVATPLLNERLARTIQGYGAEQQENIGCSVYPSISRSSLYEMSVGMDAGSISRWLRSDFETGRKPVIWTKGLDPFTGLEPEAYRQMIFGYIRTLIGMGVGFQTDLKDLLQIQPMETVAQPRIYLPQLAGNLLLAKDLRKIPEGGVIRLPDHAVITPLAREYGRDHKITFLT
jgi:hypothetical protein